MRVIRSRSGAASRPVSATFTGEVWQDNVVPAEDGVLVNTVTFLPGARTYWHHHEGGQLLQVSQGSGWVCADGGLPQRIEAGDVVHIAAGERHWHGGGADSLMSHTAISLGETVWQEPVPDEVYRAATEGENR